MATTLIPVEPLAEPNPLDFSERIDELRQLPDGWFDGKGKKFYVQGLKWLEETLTRSYPADIQLPRIYPTPEGLVLLEWISKSDSASLEIDITTGVADWHNVNLISHEDETDTVRLKDDKSWIDLAEKLRKAGFADD